MQADLLLPCGFGPGSKGRNSRKDRNGERRDKRVWSQQMHSFSRGGCVCFSDSSQPQLTDAGEETGKKCADWSDERTTEGGGVSGAF